MTEQEFQKAVLSRLDANDIFQKAVLSRLDAIDGRLYRLEDSVSTIRQTMTDDFRPAIDGLKQGMTEINRKISGGMHLRVVTGE